MVDTSPFIIRELTGDKREVQLVGRGLPYKPFTLRGTQRVEQTWLPGSPQATTTILGATESPTQIRGFWKSIFIGRLDSAQPSIQVDGAPVLTARDAVELFDDIRRQGQLLEVQWLTVLRHGTLQEFEQSWYTSEDVEWTMDFSWSSQGEVTEPVVFITDTEIGGTFSLLQEQFLVLDDIGVPDFGLSTDFLGTLQGIQQGIQDLIFQVQDTVINFTNRVLSTVRAIRGIISTLASIEDEALILIDFLSASTAGSINNETPVSEQSYSEELSAQLYVEELAAWARFMRRIAVENRVNLSRQISTDLLATFIARAGQDLRDVALLFYDDAFEWRRLLTFNDLNTIELEVGQTVLVPRLNPAEAGQEQPGV